MIKVNLKNHFDSKGISLSKIHRETGIRYATLHAMFKDDANFINLNHLRKICSVFDIRDMNDIFLIINTDNEVLNSYNQKNEDDKYASPDKFGTYKVRGSAHQIFAKNIKYNYGYQCAVSGIKTADFLVASHIIPWSVNSEIRLDPTNGICLSVFYDNAFDKGYLTLDDDFRIVISSRIKEDKVLNKYFQEFNGNKIYLPQKFKPNLKYLKWHRNELFLK